MPSEKNAINVATATVTTATLMWFISLLLLCSFHGRHFGIYWIPSSAKREKKHTTATATTTAMNSFLAIKQYNTPQNLKRNGIGERVREAEGKWEANEEKMRSNHHHRSAAERICWFGCVNQCLKIDTGLVLSSAALLEIKISGNNWEIFFYIHRRRSLSLSFSSLCASFSVFYLIWFFWVLFESQVVIYTWWFFSEGFSAD